MARPEKIRLGDMLIKRDLPTDDQPGLAPATPPCKIKCPLFI